MKRYFSYVYILNKLWLFFAISLIIISVSISSLREFIPYISKYKPQISQWLLEKHNLKINIKSLGASWDIKGPSFNLKELEIDLLAKKNKKDVLENLSIENLDIQLNLFSSLRNFSLVFSRLEIKGLTANLDLKHFSKDKENKTNLSKTLEKIFLKNLPNFNIVNSKLNIKNKAQLQSILIEKIHWQSQEEKHLGNALVFLDNTKQQSISLTIDLPKSFSEQRIGNAFVKLDNLDLSPFLSNFNQKKTYIKTDLNALFWTKFSFDKIYNFDLNVLSSSFVEQVKNKKKETIIKNASVAFEQEQNDYIFNLSNFSFVQEQKDHTLKNLSLRKKENYLIANSSSFELVTLTSFLSSINFFNNHKINFLEELKLKGNVALKKLYFSKEQKQISVAGNIKNLSWQETYFLPALNNIDINFSPKDKNTNISFIGNNTNISGFEHFLEDLIIEKLRANFLLSYDNLLQVFSDDILIQTADFSARSSVNFFDLKNKNLELLVDLSYESGFENLAKYYPKKFMQKELRNYLNSSLLDGKINKANLIYRGKLDDFLKKDANSIFQAKIELENGEFNFATPWNNVKNIDSTILFENDSFDVFVKDASLNTIKSKNAHLKIDSFFAKNPKLNIHLNATANSFEADNFFAKTPIKKTMKNVFSFFSVEKQQTVYLNISVPLLSPFDFNISGKTEITNSNILLKDEFLIKNTNAIFSFNDLKINLKGYGFLHDDKVSFSLNGKNINYPKAISPLNNFVTINKAKTNLDSQNSYQLQGSVKKLLNIKNLKKKYQSKYLQDLNGKFFVTSNFYVNIFENQTRLNIDLNSSLKGLEINLPKPFYREKEHITPFKMNISGNLNSLKINAIYDYKFRFLTDFDLKNNVFSPVNIVSGDNLYIKSDKKQANTITVTKDEIDLFLWHEVLKRYKTKDLYTKPKEQKSFLKTQNLNLILNTDKLFYKNYNLNNSILDINYQKNLVTAEIKSKEVDLSLVYKEDSLWTYIDRLDLKKENLRSINIDKKSQKAEELIISKKRKEIGETLDLNLVIECKKCAYENHFVDSLRLELAPYEDKKGIQVKQFLVNLKDTNLTVNGGFFKEKNKDYQTQLNIELNSNDSTAMFKSLGYKKPMIDGAKVKITNDIFWNGTFFDFDLENLQGKSKLKITDGSIQSIDDKGLNFLGLLSFDSILRKLRLDFSDVFADGLYFSQISGDAKIIDGVFITDNSRINGDSILIDFDGKTDLKSQTLDYDVAIRPKLTSNLPLLSAFAITPITGVYVFALTKVIDPALAVVYQINLKVTGDLNNPKVEEVDRKERKLKQEEIDKLNTQNH